MDQQQACHHACSDGTLQHRRRPAALQPCHGGQALLQRGRSRSAAQAPQESHAAVDHKTGQQQLKKNQSVMAHAPGSPARAVVQHQRSDTTIQALGCNTDATYGCDGARAWQSSMRCRPEPACAGGAAAPRPAARAAAGGGRAGRPAPGAAPASAPPNAARQDLQPSGFYRSVSSNEALSAPSVSAGHDTTDTVTVCELFTGRSAQTPPAGARIWHNHTSWAADRLPPTQPREAHLSAGHRDPKPWRTVSLASAAASSRYSA